ncbi:LysR family transcriptional regulator substrate-binding protein [Phaeovulum sp. NW3]|uniref:LysR family transcriptional regulator substrate-binding protein n=1 Tax=Phaeovulum sp. NW3 TaxID=2934933 RepID=UPI0020207609|nr:LysR family transcriptional regulator substrate-binding protein [Phaeovulum sp. NW3]MCL7466451.1 LysR family transcriptional regulator substrate-binding protein [Phaeovulum sp. NW3]
MQNRRIINKHFADAGISPRVLIESNSTVVLVANVLSGDWLTILPADIARFLVTGKPLRTIPMAGTGRGHSVGLLAPWREPHTPVLQALLAEAGQISELS